MQNGKFITFEGTDGSGKTTQIKLLEEYLKNKGYEVVFTREPGGTKVSELIRDIILDPENTEINPLTEMILYSASRAQLVAQVIKPAIKAGKIIICDRFIDSSYAYQGYGRGIDLKMIAEVNRVAVDGVSPDVTFFMDVNPEIAIKRRINESDADRIEQEKIDFHRRVYEGYKKMALLFPDRIVAINASKPIDQVSNQINKYIDDVL